ncbi:MAG: DUF4386 domain-containing protein [Geothrix sp.]|uniref:DUF4386 domain-containing protein n=1 Tax=Candidatus Geothrix odensensis TaxID=2954440 RepID=A0A936F5G4_9BACT|nr:DUF4386 domain-containing protein [Candidatus Geothrix odensensis]MCC6513748.1 DUF4386 domain-containing protein [Geothrix sp.]
MDPNPNALSRTARYAGILYLVWIVTGFYSMLYLPSKIPMRGEPDVIAQNILAHEFVFRTSIINGILSGALWVVMVLVFYQLFKAVNDRQARLLVALVIIQIPMILVLEALKITSLMLLKGGLLKSFALLQRQEVALLLLKVEGHGAWVLELFWGLWLLPLAALVYRSRFLPRFLGVWLGVCGLAYVVLFLIDLLALPYRSAYFRYAFPAMLGEIAFMLWLVIKGATVPPAEPSVSPGRAAPSA